MPSHRLLEGRAVDYLAFFVKFSRLNKCQFTSYNLIFSSSAQAHEGASLATWSVYIENVWPLYSFITVVLVEHRLNIFTYTTHYLFVGALVWDMWYVDASSLYVSNHLRVIQFFSHCADPSCFSFSRSFAVWMFLHAPCYSRNKATLKERVSVRWLVCHAFSHTCY